VQLAGLYLLRVVNPRAIGWIFNVKIQVREQETFEKLHEKCKLLNHTYSSTPPSAHYMLLFKDYAATCAKDTGSSVTRLKCRTNSTKDSYIILYPKKVNHPSRAVHGARRLFRRARCEFGYLGTLGDVLLWHRCPPLRIHYAS
jgi:hypothetical protein